MRSLQGQCSGNNPLSRISDFVGTMRSRPFSGLLPQKESNLFTETMSLVDEGNRSKNKAVCVNVSEKRPFSFAESHRAAWRTCKSFFIRSFRAVRSRLH